MEVTTRRREDAAFRPLCAFCRDSIDDAPATCPGCQTQLHRECCLEVRECPSLGCRVQPRKILSGPPPDARRTIRVAPLGRGREIGTCSLCRDAVHDDDVCYECPGCSHDVHQVCRDARPHAPCPNRACSYGLDGVERFTPVFEEEPSRTAGTSGPTQGGPGDRLCLLCMHPRQADQEPYVCAACGTAVHSACRERHLHGPCPNRRCTHDLTGVERYAPLSPPELSDQARRQQRLLVAALPPLACALVVAAGALCVAAGTAEVDTTASTFMIAFGALVGILGLGALGLLITHHLRTRP